MSMDDGDDDEVEVWGLQYCRHCEGCTSTSTVVGTRGWWKQV